MKNHQNVKNSPGFRPWKMAKNCVVLTGLLACAGLARANPSGGSVAAGSATISGTGTPSVTINQLSNTAIINWNSFSISSGEVTTFVQPSAASAVLNRVTGGGITSIDGTLNANGQVFVINGNGVYIGKSGAVNTAGFAASTLDISDKDFEKNNLQFNGSSSATVQNLGTISAGSGDIYLIGQTVDNEGSLSALNGTVGLAAAQSVLIKQSGTQHVFVSSTPGITVSSGAAAVTNRGSIIATAAELRAANGNMYALAINNGGTIRASTVQKQGGRVYLTADSGVIVNTGSVDASATAAGATGGTIQFKTSSSGTVVNHGLVISHGGQGGTGGTVDLSGGTLDFTGGVDLTTVGGKTGSLLLDPSSITVNNDPNANGTVTTTGTVTTYMPAPNFPGGVSTLYNVTLEAQLAIANVIVDGVNNVTVNAPVTWTDDTASIEGAEFASTLTLETTGKAGTININQAITAHLTDLTTPANPSTGTGARAGLTIDAQGNGFVTTGPSGSIDVDNFTLEAGIWQQIVTPNPPTAAQLKAMPGLMTALPGFNVTNDFQLDGTSTFERFAGGDGLAPTPRQPNNSPYQIVDIYGLQGIGSPSDKLLSGQYILNNDINYDAGTQTVTNTTINWNGGDGIDGGAGWVPIGEGGASVKPFTGVLNGNGFTVAGFYYYRGGDDLTGMFGELSGTVENLTLDDDGAYGTTITALLVGRVNGGGVINNCVAYIDHLAEPTPPSNPGAGTTSNQSDLPDSALGVSQAAGGIVGEVERGGLVENSGAFAGYELLGTSGVFGLTAVGGLDGVNYGTITNCSSGEAGTTSNSIQAIAGARNPSAASESISIGGLVGANYGTINGGECSGDISPVGGAGSASILSGVGNFNVGGFVGVNYGTIDGTIVIGGRNGAAATYQAFSIDSITVPDGADISGGTGSYYVGGFVGANYGSIANGYCAPTIGGVMDTVGDNFGAISGGGTITIQNNLQPGALGDIALGGFAGGNFGSITHSGSEDAVVGAANIKGVGTINERTRSGIVPVPEPANFDSPLNMDSIFIGGFVGLNGPRSSISQSFCDSAAQTIQFTLDPTQATPTLAALGDTFTLVSDPNVSDLVTTTGNITGGTGYYITGGFAGGNYGSISTSYSTANVNVAGTTTQSNSFYTGGFAGVNSGAIANVFETGGALSQTTTANPQNQTGVVGGLVAQMNGGSVTFSYELGTVSGGTTREGLVGVRAAGTFSHSFWDTDDNPNLVANAELPGALGETTLALEVDPATEPASVFATAGWNFKTIWVAPAGTGTPTLLNVP